VDIKMIEYITNTGIFGILWIANLIVCIILSFFYTRKNGFGKYIGIMIPVFLIGFMFNFVASELIGKTQFDNALQLVKDFWFIFSPTMLTTLILFADPYCMVKVKRK
jgi:formate/nitrite transporter FocA (FNT family)